MGLSVNDVTGLGKVAEFATTIVQTIWPDKTEQQKAELVAAVQLVQGQIDINKVEAASPRLLVSGWRPFIGWVCGAACAWNWLGLPVALFALSAAGRPLDLKPADLSEMWPILIALLGLGGFRTTEKIAGKA